MHDERLATGIDTDSSSVARGYDHWLGGKDNFEVESFLDGLDLLPPGLVRTVDWWPEGPLLQDGAEITNLIYAALAKKP